MTSTLAKISVKVWSYTTDYPTNVAGTFLTIVQHAWDVTVAEADGSILVVGSITGGFVRSTSRSDCFVLKLDAQLNRIWAMSIGQTTLTKNLVCNSI